MKSEGLDTHDDGYFRGNYRLDEEADMKVTLQKLDISVSTPHSFVQKPNLSVIV